MDSCWPEQRLLNQWSEVTMTRLKLVDNMSERHSPDLFDLINGYIRPVFMDSGNIWRWRSANYAFAIGKWVHADTPSQTALALDQPHRNRIVAFLDVRRGANYLDLFLLVWSPCLYKLTSNKRYWVRVVYLAGRCRVEYLSPVGIAFIYSSIQSILTLNPNLPDIEKSFTISWFIQYTPSSGTVRIYNTNT